jgi:hypothetical protein
MVNFYNFYTTWTFFIGAASVVALSFIVKEYHQTASEICNADIYKLNYNMYEMILFLLITTITTSILQLLGYCCCKNNNNIYDNDNDKLSNFKIFIIIIQVLLFISKCLIAIPMIIKFNENHDCINFYKDNNMYMLATFLGLFVSYTLEAIIVFLFIITYLTCNSYRSGYKTINN